MRLFLLFLFISSVKSTWILSLLDKRQWANLTDVYDICKHAPTSKTKRLCLDSPQTLKLIVLALDEAVAECQKQFEKDKWDCASRLGLDDIYLKMQGKEKALFHGLISMSSSRILAKSCAEGRLSDCTCGDLPTNSNSTFLWAGCSDNVKFGNRRTRQIFDSAEKNPMNIHNNRAGRKLITKQISQKCKCHGISGSCVTKTCWKVVPDVPTLVAVLRKKYLKASQVEIASNSSSLFLLSNAEQVGRQQRSLIKNITEVKMLPPAGELVFIEKSPDICDLKQQNGAPLIIGRECANEKECKSLCCNRGFIRIREMKKKNCNCRFIYCCRVECDECAIEIEKFYCK